MHRPKKRETTRKKPRRKTPPVSARKAARRFETEPGTGETTSENLATTFGKLPVSPKKPPRKTTPGGSRNAHDRSPSQKAAPPANPSVIEPIPGLRPVEGGKGWLVMEKPAGMSVHNAPGQDLLSHTAAQIQDPRLTALIQPDPDFGIHPVHRIDKETSGLILLAVTREAFRHLSLQFENRKVEKEYLAITHRQPEPACGAWEMPLTPKAEGRKNPAGAGERVPCETRYQVLESTSRHALISCDLKTGRKHQIRRHAAISGCPLAGDRRYAPTRAIRFLESRFPDLRLCLHSHGLAFLPPQESGIRTIRSSGMPPFFRQILDHDKS